MVRKEKRLWVQKIWLLSLMLAMFACEQDDLETGEDSLLPRASETQTSDLENKGSTEIYYSFEPDNRRCKAPMCGGYWLTAVNLDETVCPDKTIGGENGCYVAGLDLHGIELREDDLLLGEFKKVEYGAIVADHLNVESTFTPALEDARPYNWINLIQDTGIRCITTPCPSSQIVMVNTDHEWSDYGFSYDVGYKEQEILEETFLNAYATGSALVQSHWHMDWWGDWELSVTNVYVRNQPTQSEGPFCTFMKQDSDNEYTAWNVDTYEQGKNLLAGTGFEPGTENIVESTCEDYSNACLTNYSPVCGTIDATNEAKTYGNLCELEVAVRKAAGAETKAKGTWTEGECVDESSVSEGGACGGKVNPPLAPCAEGLVCKGSGLAVDAPGTCQKQDWCESDETVFVDCAHMPNLVPPAYKACVDNTCTNKIHKNGYGEQCGGIAGVFCEYGLNCQLEDGSVGTCLPEQGYSFIGGDCNGGFYSKLCVDGLICNKEEGAQPNVPGICECPEVLSCEPPYEKDSACNYQEEFAEICPNSMFAL